MDLVTAMRRRRPESIAPTRWSRHRHKLPAGHRIVKTSVLGSLHHEYSLVKDAA